MAIKIVEDEPDVVVTRTEYDRLYREYMQSVSFMVDAPSFEQFVRQRKLNESMQQRAMLSGPQI